MSIGWKVWLGVFILIIIVQVVCAFGETKWIKPSTAIDGMTELQSSTPDLGAGKVIYNIVSEGLWWNYSYLNTTMFGQWIQLFLRCLTMAILIPMLYSLIVLIVKPFRGI